MGCVATTRIMKKRITMLEIATEDSLYEAAIILICDCKWEGEDPALLKMRGWRKWWRDRAETGRWKHKVENGEDDLNLSPPITALPKIQPQAIPPILPFTTQPGRKTSCAKWGWQQNSAISDSPARIQA